MKRLYLIRHAKSSWKHPELADFDRPLNKRGKRDAPRMGKRLRKHHAKPDLIISSPAKRALKTAKIIAKEIGFPVKAIATNEAIYTADTSLLLNVIQRIEDSFDCVMLFGHNPALTMLANYLTSYRVENMPTCSIFCVDFEINSWKEVWQGRGRFAFMDYPKKHL